MSSSRATEKRAIELKNFGYQVGPDKKWFIHRPEIDKIKESGNIVGITGSGKSVILRWLLLNDPSAIYIDLNKMELISTLVTLVYETTRKIIPCYSLIYVKREKILSDIIDSLKEYDGLLLFDNIDEAEGTKRDIDLFIREIKKLSRVVVSFRNEIPTNVEFPIIRLQGIPAEEALKVIKELRPQGKEITLSSDIVDPQILPHLCSVPALESLDLSNVEAIFNNTTNWLVINKAFDLTTLIGLSILPLDERRLARALETTTLRVDELIGKLLPFVVEKSAPWGKGSELASSNFQKYILLSAGPIKREEFHKRLANMFNEEGYVFEAFFNYRGMKNVNAMLFLLNSAFDEGIHVYPSRLHKCLEWLVENIPEKDFVKKATTRRYLLMLLHMLQEYVLVENNITHHLDDLAKYDQPVSAPTIAVTGADKKAITKEIALAHLFHSRNLWLLEKTDESMKELNNAISAASSITEEEFIDTFNIELAKNYAIMENWERVINILTNESSRWEKKATRAMITNMPQKSVEQAVYSDAITKALLGIAYAKLGINEQAKTNLTKAAEKYTILVKNSPRNLRYISELTEVNEYIKHV
ncbi:MAG: hypothetical protein QXL15_02605 [Candidatus Korarchaeota archaeon]